ncbi:hypothetical protein IJH01_03450 [Candidatus Saccharibacteria bacterium]|nr:hypothetical protein [Candidatus Saccharibacteria bacterium]
MQDINDNVINSMTTDTQYQLMDNRDNKLYYIAKMQDGRVWMLDNLRLDLTNSTVINNLSSTNTNATDTQLNYLKNGGGATNDQYAVGGLSGSNVTSGFNQYYTPQVNNTYKNNIAPDVDGLGSGKIGVYYNYCATSAGSYCYNSNGGVDKQDTYRDIEGDICPAGWRLPSGNTNSSTTRITDYGTLYSAYNGATGGQALVMRNRLSIPLSGVYSGNSQGGLGTYGWFWPSTRSTTNNIYLLHTYLTDVSPGIGNSRNNGYSIRCVLGSP